MNPDHSQHVPHDPAHDSKEAYRKPEEGNVTDRVRHIILHHEPHHENFTRDEIVEEAKHEKIDEDDARHALHELIEEGWLHEVPHAEGLLARTAHRDYSQANEEHLDF